jgi:hypothetical protein
MHKLTTRLCRENQAVVIEDLNVKGMPANERRARAISDVGFWDLSPLDAPLRRAEVFPRRIRFDLRRQVPGRAAAGRQAQMNVARPRGSYIEWRQRVGYGSSGRTRRGWTVDRPRTSVFGHEETVALWARVTEVRLRPAIRSGNTLFSYGCS